MPQPPLIAPRLRRAAVGLVGVSSVVLLLLAVRVHGERSNRYDARVISWLYRHIHSSTLVSLFLDTSEPVLVLAVLAVVVVVAAVHRAWTIVALAVGGPAAAILLTEVVLKPLIARHPSGANGDPAALTFPSGHETGVASLLVVLSVLVLRTSWHVGLKVATIAAFIVWSVVAAVGLVRNFYHYPTDTVGAVAVSIATVLAVAHGRPRPRAAEG